MKEKDNIVNEPEATYLTSSLQKFNSFEEMENEQLKYFASLSPLQSLMNLRKMQLRSVKDNPKIPCDKIIQFD